MNGPWKQTDDAEQGNTPDHAEAMTPGAAAPEAVGVSGTTDAEEAVCGSATSSPAPTSRRERRRSEGHHRPGDPELEPQRSRSTYQSTGAVPRLPQPTPGENAEREAAYAVPEPPRTDVGGGLREAPGELHVHGPLRRFWERIKLVPLIILVLCVIAAVVAGIMRQGDLNAALSGRQAAVPPIAPGAVASAEAYPSFAECQPAPEPIPAEQPWQGAAFAESEAIFTENNVSGGERVIEGQDGWVFWSDYQWKNFSQALGRRTLSQEEMDAWYSHYKGVADELEAEGIPIVILIAPGKWDVYRDKLPTWTKDIQGSTTFDYLRAAHPDLPIIDVRDGVRAARDKADTYEPLNSHWTNYGGWAAWKTAAPCIQSLGEGFRHVEAPAITSVKNEMSNSEFAQDGYSEAPKDATTPVWAEKPSPMTVIGKDGQEKQTTSDYPADMLEAPLTTHTEHAQTDLTALIYRDSFGTALAPSWQASFATTLQRSHGISSDGSTPDIVAEAKQHKPDIVILEFTERYLHFVPGQPAQ